LRPAQRIGPQQQQPDLNGLKQRRLSIKIVQIE
jgi:hypothetical protein